MPNIDFGIIPEVILPKLIFMTLVSFVVASAVGAVIGAIATQIWRRSRRQKVPPLPTPSLIPMAILMAFICTLLGLLIWEANPGSLVGGPYGGLAAMVFYAMILPTGSLLGAIGGSIMGAVLPAHLRQRQWAGRLVAMTYALCTMILFIGLASPPLSLTTAQADAPFPVVAQIRGYDDIPKDLTLSANGKMLAVLTIERDNDKLDIWDLTAQKLIHTFKGEQPRTLKTILSSVAFSQDAQHLITAAPQEVQLRDWNGRVQQRFAGGEFGLSMQGNRLVTLAVLDPWKNPPEIVGTLKVWDSTSGKLLQTIPADISKGSYASLPIAASADYRLLAFPPTPGDSLVEVWDINTGQRVGQFGGNLEGAVRAIAFSPNGQQLATITANEKIQIWNWQESKLLNTMTSAVPVENLYWTEAGIFAASTTLTIGEQTATLWNPQTGETMKTLNSTTGFNPIAVSRDGRTISAYQYKTGLSVWNLGKG
jgi:hypothetical protein